MSISDSRRGSSYVCAKRVSCDADAISDEFLFGIWVDLPYDDE